MPGKYELLAINQCVCRHSQAAHGVGNRPGCAFCRCISFRLDEVTKQQVWTFRKPESYRAKDEDQGHRLAQSLRTTGVFSRFRKHLRRAGQSPASVSDQPAPLDS